MKFARLGAKAVKKSRKGGQQEFQHGRKPAGLAGNAQ
jgi:hypothetical protein